jgi:phosphopantothenoylcysteine decarboxylase/phosphopantothenate--cysteine ligase
VPLVRNPDVLAELVTKRAPGQLVVGFAAETGDDDADVLTHAKAKLARKGCDLLVVNDVSGGQVFGRADNAVTVLTAAGAVTELPHDSKDAVAAGIWVTIATQLSREPQN